MPRGFLVKRTRKSCGSYRIPCDGSGPDEPVSFTSVLDALTPYKPPSSNPGESEGDQGQHQEPGKVDGVDGASSDASPIKMPTRKEPEEPWKQLSYSPVKPVDLEMKKTFFKRYLSSPASADSFPVAETFSSMEKLFNHPFLTPETKLQGNPSHKPIKVHPKKAKVCRKLHFTDEVTTSPVLGLKIKAEEPDRKPKGGRVQRPPLGEFICQLCKEQYPDPFALAQHKCSRIVRVEYRCPECDKIFSCPANLASHRRWHKPRFLGADGPGGKNLQAPLEGKENSRGTGSTSGAMVPQPASSRVQHQQAADSSRVPDQHPRTRDSSYPNRADSQAPSSRPNPQDGEDEVFDCPYCHKRFRRHAYLRKHLLSHQAFNPLERGQHSYPCTLCGVHFPSMDIRDKHRLWHAVREELLVPLEEAMLAEGGQQIFPCELCPTAFFSAPGLSLHMSKCHSPHSRQDMQQQIPIGPGC